MFSFSSSSRYLGFIAFFLLSNQIVLGGERPYEVKIEGKKTTFEEVNLPIDPTIRINHQRSGNMSYGLTTSDNKRLTFSSGSARTNFKIEGQLTAANCRQVALPDGPRGKKRTGVAYHCQIHGIDIYQEQVIIPTKLPGKTKPGQKRKMDALLVKFRLENKGNQPKKIAVRTWIDMYNWTTDGPLFAAPTTVPNEVLNGVSLTGKKVPDYLMSLQQPNLQNPGHVAYFTFEFGKKYERPSNLVLTRHGANAPNGWDAQALRIAGDSDIVIYWDEKVLQPGQVREFMYSYGTGIATNPEDEGRLSVRFGGSFEPKKQFRIYAYVENPAENQTLHLQLPDGMTLKEGNPIVSVPPANDNARSHVSWYATVERPGTFPIRIRSSTGNIETQVITVSEKK